MMVLDKTMDINFKKIISKANSTLFIIGEAGVNHNGDICKAKELVDVAITAGCDAVKFQTWKTEKVYSKELSIKPGYQKRSTDREESEFDTIKKLELSFDEFTILKTYCDKKGIIFISTPDEEESVDFLTDELKVPLLKTASQDVTNIPFLEYISAKGVPLIFSTGGADLAEVIDAVSVLIKRNKDLIILHCLSAYPAPVEELNLNFIPKISGLTNCTVGFSDHTIGSEAACAALALGAVVFEKHFTLNRNQEGPDHQASLLPEELKEYVKNLRCLKKGLGDGYKKVMPSEIENRKAFRRFLVSSRFLPKGKKFDREDFLYKKVSTGIPPKQIFTIIDYGRAAVDIPEGKVISWEDVSFR